MAFLDALNSSFFFALKTIVNNVAWWLPIVLAYSLWEIWYRYKQAIYIRDTQWSLLEIKIPQLINKSPQAMELVFGIMHQGFEGTWLTRFTQGIVRSWFSLELVSVGGQVRFLVRVPKFFRNLVESHIYSQYPEVEIYEVEDYTRAVAYHDPAARWSLWAGEFVLTKADPYPIKTYVDYQKDSDLEGKDMVRVDPLTPILELLGSLGPNEQIWIQILVMSTKDRFRIPGKRFGRQGWKEEGAALVNQLMKRDEAKAAALADAVVPGSLLLSPGERHVVEAVERSISKLGFDCGLRAVYLAREGKFNVFNQVGLLSGFKQFGSLHLNGFKPGLKTSFDFPWQDLFGWRLKRRKRQMFEAYCRRSYFYPPFARKPFVLNTEELATIYHFPGLVATTPTLGRIESKRGEPPTNLPL